MAFATTCRTHGRRSGGDSLDDGAYDGRRSIRGTALSDDGRYAAYWLVPEDGDPTLVAHDFRSG